MMGKQLCMVGFMVWALMQVCQAQDLEFSSKYMGLYIHRGIILPHSKELKPISNTPVTAIQLDIGRFSGGEQAFNQCNCSFNSGISLQVADFGNSKELGQSMALTGYMEPYLFTRSAWQISFRYGLGLNYLNRVYHSETNPRNVFYSSPISFLTYLNLNAALRVSPHTHLNTGLFYNHISNGGMRMPNKGMNFPTLSLGLDYALPARNFDFIPASQNANHHHNIWLFVQSAFSAKTYSGSAVKQGRLLPVISFQAGSLYSLGKLSAIGLAVEYMDDRFQQQNLADYQINLPHQQVGALATHAFTFGRWILAQQYGLYVYNRDPQARTAYQRYQLMYRVFEDWHIGGSLKAHRHIADVFDVRIMWHLNTSK
jgi:hypothetical protein